MLFDKDARLSARVFGRVLYYPLYDGDCCPAARELLAAGDIAGAVAAWQRLASLGSGTARCILAYLHLMGCSSVPADWAEARRLASSAIVGARGYANYVLGCISLREKQYTDAARYLTAAFKAGFFPAGTHLASMALRGGSQEMRQIAFDVLRKTATAGHRPALLLLARVYASGDFGFVKRLFGLMLVIPAFVKLLIALKFQVFSLQSCQIPISHVQPLFNDVGIDRTGTERTARSIFYRSRLIRSAHLAAGIAAVSVLLFARRLDGNSSTLASIGLAVLTAWPYALSYLIASRIDVQGWLPTLVETLALCIVTMFVCSAYSGQMFTAMLATSEIAGTSAVQAFLFVSVYGVVQLVTEEMETPDLPTAPARRRIIWIHLILGVLAAGSWLLRPGVWSGGYWEKYGFSLIGFILSATIPYLIGTLVAWRSGPFKWQRLSAYVAVLIAGTALAVCDNSGLWQQSNVLSVWFVLLAQSVAFFLVGEWALDDAD